MNHLCRREKYVWKAIQTNFTAGVNGSLNTNLFVTRLESLGVKNKNEREIIIIAREKYVRAAMLASCES